jgi:gas vesicle protein
MARRDEKLLEELEELRRRLAERDDQEGGIMGFLGGMVLGMLMGGTLALIFAPKSGEETRTQLRDTSIQLKERATTVADQVKEQAGTVQTQAQDALGQVRERAQSLTETAREQVQGVTARTQEAAGAIGEEARQTADTAREQAQGLRTQAQQAVEQTRSAAQPGQGGGAQGQPGQQGQQSQGAGRPGATGDAGGAGGAGERPQATTGATIENQPELTRHYGNPDEQANRAGGSGRQG